MTWSAETEEITISLTDEFANYEQNTDTTPNPVIQVQMDLLCGDTNFAVVLIYFKFYIQLTNRNRNYTIFKHSWFPNDSEKLRENRS